LVRIVARVSTAIPEDVAKLITGKITNISPYRRVTCIYGYILGPGLVSLK